MRKVLKVVEDFFIKHQILCQLKFLLPRLIFLWKFALLVHLEDSPYKSIYLKWTSSPLGFIKLEIDWFYGANPEGAGGSFNKIYDTWLVIADFSCLSGFCSIA